MSKKTLYPEILDLKALKAKIFPAPRPHDAHKGNFGHVLAIGGDYGMAGAMRIVAEAAIRIGAGLVSVATRPENVNIINTVRPEIMAHGLKNYKSLEPLIERATFIVIGNGLGQSAWSKNLLVRAVKSQKPLLIDADGLNILATLSDFRSRDNCILTPHPKEAARLLGMSVDGIQQNRCQAAMKLQKKYNGTIVLKGSGSIVCDTENKLSLCTAGNPGMASAGMGDLLSGIIGGLCAQSNDVATAAKFGVILHAISGDQAAEESGERGLLALDLLPYIRHHLNFNS